MGSNPIGQTRLGYMKQCLKCSGPIQNWIKVNGKSHCIRSRKYCLSCSPFGKHNTRTLTDNSVPEKGSKNLGTERICIQCNKTFIYQRKAQTLSICATCFNREARHNIKAALIAYKGGQCEKCGYNKSNRALNFHHLDPTKKEFQISSRLNGAMAELKVEADKCLLLCANCHMEVHEQLELDNKLPSAKIWNEKKPTESARCACGKPTSGVQCKSCHDTNRPTKITWPDASELQRLVWEMPCSKLALTLGISDKAIEKQCKKLGITKPPRGYWACINAPDNKGT